MKALLLSATISLILPLQSNAVAATTVGSKCAKAGTFTLINSKVFICTKKGTSLSWIIANPAQALIFQKQQQALTIASRHEKLTELLGFKSRYVDANSLLPTLEMDLISTANSLNQALKDEIARVVSQQESTIKLSAQTQTNFVEVIAALNSNQANIDAMQTKVNSQVSVTNTAKSKNDAAYTSYLAVKTQSDALSSAYQSASNSNAYALAAKILCDFGFAGCSGFDSNLYNYNASIIRQYNQASANTTAAYNIYSDAYSQYASAYDTWKSLNSQLTDLKTAQDTLTTKKNELSAKYIDLVSNIKTLQATLDADNSKLKSSNDALRMIDEISQKFSSLTQDFQAQTAQFNSALNNFINVADESYIVKASTVAWNGGISGLFSTQEHIEAILLEMKSLKFSLESSLKSLEN